MNNPAYYDAIERFVNHLESSGLKKRLNLNDEDIADTFWLALQIGVEKSQIVEKPDQDFLKELINDNNFGENQTSETVPPPINLYTPPPDPQPKKPVTREGYPFKHLLHLLYKTNHKSIELYVLSCENFLHQLEEFWMLKPLLIVL